MTAISYLKPNFFFFRGSMVLKTLHLCPPTSSPSLLPPHLLGGRFLRQLRVKQGALEEAAGAAAVAVAQRK